MHAVKQNALELTEAITPVEEAEIVTPAALAKHTANEVLEIIKNDKAIQAGDMHKITALARR